MTFRFISFAAAFLISLFMCAFAGGFAWSFTAGVFAIMLCYSLISVILMRCTTSFENIGLRQRVQRGENVSVGIRISSKFALPFSRTIIECSHGKILADVPIMGETVVNYNVECPHCGAFFHGADRIYLIDAFGLCKIKSKKISGRELTMIVPKVKKLRRDSVGENQDRHSLTMRKTREHEEIAGIRPFEDGDTVKNIHWKQSARRSKLMTTEYEESADNSVLIVIDRNCSDRRALNDGFFKADIAAEYAISVVSSAVENGKSVHSVITCASTKKERDLSTSRKIADMEMDYAILTPVLSNEHPFMTGLFKSVGNYACVIYICYEIDVKLIETINALHGKCTAAKLVAVGVMGEGNADNIVYLTDDSQIEKMQVPYGC